METGMKNTFLFAALLVAAAFAPAGAGAGAQAWPSKPIRIVVPYPAGGATDLASRAFAQSMGKRLNQAIVVENRGGAGGAIGLEAAASAPADGYTFVVGTAGNFAVNPHLMKNVRYDVQKSFAPVCMMALAPVALFANASLPANNLSELVAWSKANPGKLNFATDGQATIPHIGGEYLKQLIGVNMTHVPYKGSASATQAALAGDTQLALTGIANAIPHVRAGKLKPIGVAGAQRLSLFPQVPTLIEQGARGFDLGSWFAMFGPAGVDPAVVAQIGKACRDSAAEPAIRESLSGAALEVVTSTPDELREKLAADLQRWGEMVTASGVKSE
jgi:tripartite-type tricarboxylate transporter receptor subunit TctC